MQRHRDDLGGHAPQVERQPGASAEAGDLVRVRIRVRVRVRVRDGLRVRVRVNVRVRFRARIS